MVFMSNNWAGDWQANWNAGAKYKCEYCGKFDYTDYYCGGCGICCDEQITIEMEEFGRELNEGQK
jgi:hypothetical protein